MSFLHSDMQVDNVGENNEISSSSVENRNDTHYSGAEKFIVGLSPSYWSHIPLNIVDIHNLNLVNGLHCRVTCTTPSNNDNNKEYEFYPISKCSLQGMIVSAEQKSRGNVSYVLDDGTGIIDCIDWQTIDPSPSSSSSSSLPYANDELMFSLPSLTSVGNCDYPIYEIGTFVRIFGRINGIAVLKNKKDTPTTYSTDVFHKNGGSESKKWISHDTCVREIQISHIMSIPEKSIMNKEAHHWQTIISNPTNNSSILQDKRSQQQSSIVPNYHVTDIINKLGSRIAQQIKRRENLPSPNDIYSSWRVFGISCCCTLPYKTSLLYCHCRAQVEPLDQGFTFRDCLLNILLSAEQNVPSKQPLFFKYKSICQNETLIKVSTNIITNNATAVSASSNNNNNNDNKVNFRLLQGTFRALRNDGIIYLVDLESDTYMLISRDRVLEPFVRKEMATNQKGTYIRYEKTPFLRKVHHERLLYIKRCLTANT